MRIDCFRTSDLAKAPQAILGESGIPADPFGPAGTSLQANTGRRLAAFDTDVIPVTVPLNA